MAESNRPRRSVPDAFKLEAVAAIRGGRSVSAVAAELGLPDRLVRAWLRWAEGRTAAGSGAPVPTPAKEQVAPDRVWLADLTYIWTAEGWLYLAVVLDLFSRRVVGWAMADHLGHELALAALDMAIARQRPAPGLIHHSDRGVQFAAHEYRKRLQQHGILCSMSRKGNCWDNAPMESFYATLKGELVEQRDYLTQAEARADIFQFLEGWYNRRRLHSALGYLTPEQKVAAFHAAASAAQHCP